MEKEFAVKVLNRIKQINEAHSKLNDLGVNLIELDNGVNLLEESIAVMFAKSEKSFERILDDVQWWLYENVEKTIWIEGEPLDVSTPELFVDWIEKQNY